MTKEKWNWNYVTFSDGKQKITLKVLHYQSFSPYPQRSWYRVYDHGVEGTLRESVINKRVGYGDTLEEAILKLFEVRNARGA